MADNVAITVGLGTDVATDDVGGVHYQRVKIAEGADGSATDVSSANPLPVGDAGGSLTVDGPLTDAELRATAVPVSGPLTDAQLRATAVPVSGTVTASGPLTDAQLRATAVPVSAASLPLPSGAATAANQSTGNTALTAIQTAAQLLDDTVKTDDAAFTPATDKVLMVGAQADETTPDAVNEGDAGALRMTLSRGLHTNLRDASGTELLGSKASAASIPVVVASDQASISIKDSSGNAIEATALGQAAMAASLPVTIASDQSAVPVSHAALTELAAAISTEVQVDVVGALPAGTNNIGDVDIASALPAGTNNIGDVDIASALPAGTNNIGDVDVASIVPVTAVSASGTLDALDETVVLEIQGRPWVGVTILPGGTTLTGSLTVEYSCDDGTTWEEKIFWNGDAMVQHDVLPESGATQRHYSLFPNPAETHVRVRVSAYTSGSATAKIVANATFDPTFLFVPHVIDYGDVTLGEVNAACEVSTYGRTVGFALFAGTLAATLRVQASPDRGVTWRNISSFNGASLVGSWAVTNPNAEATIIVPLTAGYSKVRQWVNLPEKPAGGVSR